MQSMVFQALIDIVLLPKVVTKFGKFPVNKIQIFENVDLKCAKFPVIEFFFKCFIEANFNAFRKEASMTFYWKG